MNRNSYGRILTAALISLAFTLLLACGDDDHKTTTPAKPVPTSLSASGSSTQSTLVGSGFADLSVKVLDQNSKPASGVSVTFTAPTIARANCQATTKKSGARPNGCAPSVPTCAFSGGASSTGTTDSSGVANSGVCTANDATGTYTVSAAVSGISTPATFTLTNTPGPAATILTSSGWGQTAAVGTAFATPLVVTVFDSHFNVVTGVTVTFASPSSGASCTFANGITTAVSNTQGNATSAVCTANNNVGSYSVMASAGGVTSPAAISLTNSVGAPSIVTATLGSAQTAAVSTVFELPLIATVVDSHANPISGVTVTFTAPSSGASCAFAGGVNTATTDSLGTATSTACTADSTIGSYTVSASASGVSTPAAFSLSNVTGTVASITATAGSGQNTLIGTAFSLPLTATVLDTASNPVSGAQVTFTAPPTCAGGSFQSTTNATETVLTDASGVAVSSVFTANAAAGPFVVTAATGDLSAGFNLTNILGELTGSNYVFYLRGINPSGNFYTVAGAVNIDGSGNVQAGEQDYNEGISLPAPPSPPPPSSTLNMIGALNSGLVVDPISGMGTLTLNTCNPGIGVEGTQTLAVQFVNPKHAMIIQFDGSATSTGTLDLQTATTPADQGYAMILSGIDSNYVPAAVGGVFTLSNNTITSGVIDENVGGQLLAGEPFFGQLSGTDSFGRGTIGFDETTTLAYYVVGPQVMRWTGTVPSAIVVGSAFGQGLTTTFDNTSLGNTVFGVEGNSHSYPYAAAGMFSVPASGTLTGIGDVDEVGRVLTASLTGTYTISNSIKDIIYNGYGNLTISPDSFEDVSAFGIYMTDPTLNLNDPNNLVGGGGAVVLDMDPMLAGGTGFLLPQTDTNSDDFNGTFAFQSQDYNPQREFDFVGSALVGFACPCAPGIANLSFSGAADLNDIYGFFDIPNDYTAAAVSGSAQADIDNPGRYTIPGLTIAAGLRAPRTFNMVVYQANSTELVWMDEDRFSLSLGLLQQRAQPILQPNVKQHGKKRQIK